MGINVYLKDEAGAVLDSVDDAGMILSKFAMSAPARESRILRYLDPFGDLILNRAQATALLEDLAGILPNVHGPTKAILERTRGMAERCERKVHLYLWFVGD